MKTAMANGEAPGGCAVIFSHHGWTANRQLIIDRTAAVGLRRSISFPKRRRKAGPCSPYGSRLSELFLEVMPRQLAKLSAASKLSTSRSNSRPSWGW